MLFSEISSAVTLCSASRCAGRCSITTMVAGRVQDAQRCAGEPAALQQDRMEGEEHRNIYFMNRCLLAHTALAPRHRIHTLPHTMCGAVHRRRGGVLSFCPSAPQRGQRCPWAHTAHAAAHTRCMGHPTERHTQHTHTMGTRKGTPHTDSSKTFLPLFWRTE